MEQKSGKCRDTEGSKTTLFTQYKQYSWIFKKIVRKLLKILNKYENNIYSLENRGLC